MFLCVDWRHSVDYAVAGLCSSFGFFIKIETIRARDVGASVKRAEFDAQKEASFERFHRKTFSSKKSQARWGVEHVAPFK